MDPSMFISHGRVRSPREQYYTWYAELYVRRIRFRNKIRKLEAKIARIDLSLEAMAGWGEHVEEMIRLHPGQGWEDRADEVAIEHTWTLERRAIHEARRDRLVQKQVRLHATLIRMERVIERHRLRGDR